MNTSQTTANKNQVFWQILLPFFIGMLIIFYIGFLLFTNRFGGERGLRAWTDLAFLIIALPMMDFLLIILLFVVLMLFGVRKLTTTFKKFQEKFSAKIFSIAQKPGQVTRIALKPLFRYLEKNHNKG